MTYINITLNVNGFDVKARYFQDDLKKMFLPLLKTLSDMKKQKEGRLIVYLAAPPGAGKTTLSLFLEWLSETLNDIKIQSIGIDGFHYPQTYIEKHSVIVGGQAIPMQRVKGSPETYDLQRLTDSIKLLQKRDIKWPIYDRHLHDVVQDVISIRENIILIEGNWLLLDEEGWRELRTLCDYSIFVTAEESMLKKRLIQRKILGGTSPKQASEFYKQSDGVNVLRALNSRLASNCELTLLENGKFHMLQG